MAPSPDPVLTAIPTLLKKLPPPGDFYGAGTVELPVVRLAVKGVGDLGLPIPPVQAQALRAAAEDAPYGRGTRTLVDQDVRRCGQIEPAAVRADDPRWRATLDGIVASAAKALGVKGAVQAELYKMLVYGPGDFFVEHRDTEKCEGMFATLVVVLPSAHEGGELVVRHNGREATLSLSGDDPGVARWAAFYCDCAHELKPLRSGHRVALVYNLARNAKRTPRAPDATPVVDVLAGVLREWSGRTDAPPKIVVPLAHRYSLAEIDFGALKNQDAAAAQALLRAATQADCALRLAVLSIKETGSAEPEWTGRRRYDEEDDGPQAYEVVEVIDRDCTLRTWRGPDGGHEDYGAIRVDEEQEVAPPDALDEAEPDEDQLHEATGNGGASYERTFRWAALVLWPNARELEVLEQGGADALLGAVERDAKTDRERACSLARHVTAAWSRLRGVGPTVAPRHARALRLFETLGDPALVSELLAAIAATGGLAGAWGHARSNDDEDLDDEDDEDLDDEDDDLDDEDLVATPRPAVLDGGESARREHNEVDAVVSSLAKLPAEDARRIATALVKARGGLPFFPLARMLREVATSRRDDAMRSPVEDLAAALPAMKQFNSWTPMPYEEHTRGLRELLCAAEIAGDAPLAQRVSQTVVEARDAAPFDAVLVPCVLAIRTEQGRPPRASVAPLLDAVRAHLAERCALPLDAPPNATREDDGLTCRCAHCASLRVFLRDPVATQWQLRAAQQARTHVEVQIRNARVDVATSTIRKGNPHTLMCTKTTTRYEARVRQRVGDSATLAVIDTWQDER
jgi:hypothetical protein